jgi:glucose/mannose-6-phosphate isomerase
VVCAGGALAELAAEHGTARVTVPPGLQPRAALGHLALPLLAVLARVGLVPDMAADFDEALRVMAEGRDRFGHKQPSDDNPAKQLAHSLAGKVGIIYGGQGPAETIAYRFKCDLNETAKSPAWSNAIPELNHNELVALNHQWAAARDHFVVVYVADPLADPRVHRRWELTRSFVNESVREIVEVPLVGESLLARLLGGLFFTQLVSVYTAFLNDVDPGPVEVLERLKRELKEESRA